MTSDANGREFVHERLMSDLFLSQPPPQGVVVGQEPVHLGRQRVHVREVHCPNSPSATDLVFIGRADAAAGRADLGSAVGRRIFPKRVQFPMYRPGLTRWFRLFSGQCGPISDALGGGGWGGGGVAQARHFGDKGMRIEDDAIADHRQIAPDRTTPEGRSDSL